MEVLSRRVDFAFGISSWKGNPYLVSNSKRRVKINGCSLFGKPFRILSSPVLTARCRKTTVMAALKRVNEAPRRRNALRHKLMEQQEQVRQSNLEVHGKDFGENNVLAEENFTQNVEKKISEVLVEGLNENLERHFSEGMGEDFGDGLANNSSEGLKERLAEGFKEGLEEVPEGELKETFKKMWDRLESLNSELEKKPKVKNVFEVANSGKARGVKLGEAFTLLVGGIRVPPIVKYSFFSLVFVYGCLFLWGVRKYLFSDESLEKKAFEGKRSSQMLMRKKKARMEKGTTQRDFVARNDGRDLDFKVSKVKESGELVKEVGSAYKVDPNLNEDERKKRILATTSLSKGKLTIDDREFDEKVQMIRSMAREARKMEQKNKRESEKSGTDAGENVDSPGAANAVLDTDRSRSASGLDPRDVSLLASTLRTLFDNNKTNKKIAESATRKDEHSNRQNGIVAGISNSSNVESGNLTDANAADDSELNTLSPVSDSSNKADTNVMKVKADAKDLMPMDAPASSVAFMDCKGDVNGTSNGVVLKENEQPLMKNEIIAEVTTTKTEDFNVQNSIMSKKLDMKHLSSSNKVGSVNAADSNGLDASAYVADSVNKGKTSELKSVDECASAAAVLNSKGGENISDGATAEEGKVDFHDQSVDSNGAEVNKQFAHRENSGNIANMDVTEDSRRESSGHNSLIDANEKAEAQVTGECEEQMPQNRTAGAVIGQEPKAQNGKVLNKCDNISISSSKASRRMLPRVITSVEEARAILASKRGKHSNKTGESTALNALNGSSQEYDFDEQIVSSDPFKLPSTGSSLLESSIASNSSAGNKTETSTKGRITDVNFEKFRPPFKKDMVRDIMSEWEGKSNPNTTVSKVAKNEENSESDESISEEMQNEPENSTGDGKNSDPPEEAENFDWMKNDVLRDIVFKVKANEDAGKEPFDGLDSKDKDIFSRDIQKRIEREEGRVNKWVADRVENLDYGKDGIAYDDPPEVFQARWKGQDKMHNSSFIDKFKEERENIIKSKTELYPSVNNETEKPSRSAKSASSASPSTNSTLGAHTRSTSHNDPSVSSKTDISSSGKSRSFGKKSRKKSWQHTKKWSRSLQEMYVTERDPQVKGVIKDIGQDLDRWITKEEMEEVSQMLEKPAEEQLKGLERISARIKSEREKFGEEAVISKYSEYKPEKEDHLWWMDLPYVLCIELYRNIDGQMVKGLYSLDMAPDMEPTDKHFHVVAFEDRGDAKNFCYLLRSRLENGSAHVIPCHPKEVYREAQSEGYKVTVIRKAQIQMYIDKPFEEIEGIITEIGSEMYYDKILEGRTIDMEYVLKDGFGYGSQRSK